MVIITWEKLISSSRNENSSEQGGSNVLSEKSGMEEILLNIS